MRSVLPAVCAATAVAASAPPILAQAVGCRTARPGAQCGSAVPIRAATTRAVPPQSASSLADPFAPAASLLFPGAGQWRLGQRRGWVYAALEAAGWVAYIDRRVKAGDLRDRYRDLAWAVARLRTAERVDGDFRYYETMGHWLRSGAFDRDPAFPGIQPEPDPGTFNGSVWARARGLFLPPGVAEDPTDPRYRRALDYYRAHAYDDSFLWDWSSSPEAQEEFSRLIARSDQRFRQATTALGALLANHLVSAADAFVSQRMGLDPDHGFRILPPTRPGGVWFLSAWIGSLP